MGRAPCCSKLGLHRGPWSSMEDTLLTKYIQAHGEGNWRSLPKKAGLLRCGKSCRLRWLNYLRPDIKRGNIGPDEEDLIIKLHSLLGNRWSLIAGRLPGRTDNEIKNYWNTHLSKRLKNQGTNSNVHKKSKHGPTKKPRKKKTNNRVRAKNGVEGGDQTHQTATGTGTSSDIDTEMKINLPKPITRNNSIESNTVSQSCSSYNGVVEGDINGVICREVVEFPLMPWSSDNDDTEYACEPESPTWENMFENMYKEYQQLLNKEGEEAEGDHDDQMQLISFDESDWI
ncbi:hypothetical protein NE237_030948 [Protea cynaroides]|uniref:Uncharacterized protein n=1 Tax=Protea cynaroides TaxID=273540 RepID=A0A9Q0GW01_9MAGN|nr:hypothetical protein NE237_030948 [Protea cynaroides]